MEHTVEEVRALFEAWAEENGYEVLRIEPDYNDGFTAAAWHGYQAAYAERIERAQAGVTVDVVELAIAKMAAWATQNSATLVCHGSMRAALLAVWPNPPAQAAQSVDIEAIRKVIASHINEAKNLRHDPELQDYLYEQANKLEAALQKGSK